MGEEKLLVKNFYLYIIILLGFTIMSLSFIRRESNIMIILLILIPLLYLMIKSIYGLILLLESYQPFHYHLISEYNLLYLLGYNIIIFALTNNNPLYYLETIIIYLICLLLKGCATLVTFCATIIGVSVSMLYLSNYLSYNIVYIIITLITINLFLLKKL